MSYIWQRASWPRLRWESHALLEPLGEARYHQGRLFGALQTLGFEQEQAVEAEALVEEAVTTAAIEGEKLPRAAVYSSVARRLGLDHAGLPEPPRDVDGLVQMLLDATANHAQPLTAARLQGWQAALFPTGYSGIHKIVVGGWRQGPMQVVSSSRGQQRVHFEAPPARSVPGQMKRFIAWWSSTPSTLPGLVRAALAHLWFETIHPFDDGNGRIGRALADMALAQAEQRSRRTYSLSYQILAEREAYYRCIEAAQRGSGEITEWLVWFLGCITRAIQRSETLVEAALQKGRFWQQAGAHQLNPRQTKVLNRLLEAGPGGFAGGLTNRKYCSMTKAAKVTATRDLTDLLQRGLLLREGTGRATRYELNWELVH